MIRIRRRSLADLDGFALGYVLLIFVIFFDHAYAADASASVSLNNVSIKRIEALAGSDLDLVCNSSLPNYSHEWSFSSVAGKQDSLLARDPIDVTLNYDDRRSFANFILEREDKLKIRELAAGNAGVYACTSRLGESLVSRTEWILNVNGVTVRLLRARHNQPHSGCSLLLYCEVEGGGGTSASVAVQWTKNGKPIEQLAEFQQHVSLTTYTLDYDTFDTVHSSSSLPKFVPTVNNKLLIHSISKEDEAVYGCRKTDRSQFGYDFAQVRIQPSEPVEINATIVSDNELYIVQSKVEPVLNMLGQRFYWRSVRSLAGDTVFNFVENVDPEMPRMLSVASSSIVEKRSEFANKVARQNFSDEVQLKKFLNETVHNVPPGHESSTLDLVTRPNKNRFDINTTTAAGRSMIGCSSKRCSCALEQSYEVTVLSQSSSFFPEIASLMPDFNYPSFTSETVLVRVLTRQYNETHCACLSASLSTFTSFDNSLGQNDTCGELSTSAEVTTEKTTTNNHGSERTDYNQSVLEDTQGLAAIFVSETNMMLVLIAAMVSGFVVVITVTVFVVSFLMRARKRLAAAVALRKTTQSDADDAETDAHKLLDYSLHVVQVHESATHCATRVGVCQLAGVVDTDASAGMQCDDRSPVSDADSKRMEGEAGEQDRAASSSSSGATTNTSCFCSTNASLDSHELPLPLPLFPIVRT